MSPWIALAFASPPVALGAPVPGAGLACTSDGWCVVAPAPLDARRVATDGERLVAGTNAGVLVLWHDGWVAGADTGLDGLEKLVWADGVVACDERRCVRLAVTGTDTFGSVEADPRPPSEVVWPGDPDPTFKRVGAHGGHLLYRREGADWVDLGVTYAPYSAAGETALVVEADPCAPCIAASRLRPGESTRSAYAWTPQGWVTAAIPDAVEALPPRPDEGAGPMLSWGEIAEVDGAHLRVGGRVERLPMRLHGARLVEGARGQYLLGFEWMWPVLERTWDRVPYPEGDPWDARVVGVEADDVLNVRTGPSFRAAKVGEIAPGGPVRVGGGRLGTATAGFVPVELPGGTRGWVAARFLEPAPP